MSRVFSDYERQKIANEEYSLYRENQELQIVNDEGEFETIGIVREKFHYISGLDGYVVENAETKEVIVLFQGSEQPFSLGGLIDWGLNDIPMAKNIFLQYQAVTPQLLAASNKLNQILRDYPEAQISLYAHSLGGMDGQFALANVSDPSRIKEAHIYQTPNIYMQLTPAQRKTVDLLKYRIHNYVDDMDIVALRYPKSGSENSSLYCLYGVFYELSNLLLNSNKTFSEIEIKNIITYLLFFKDFSYRDENEYRIIRFFNDDTFKETGLKVVNKIVSSVLLFTNPFSLNDEKQHILSRIIKSAIDNNVLIFFIDNNNGIYLRDIVLKWTKKMNDKELEKLTNYDHIKCVENSLL